MVTKELIYREIDNVGGEYLDELYEVIRSFVRSRQQGGKQSLMSGLKNIAIDAPEDFAASHDLYM